MNLQEIRFFWHNGLKYNSLPNILISVFTLIGVWFKDYGMFTNLLFILFGFLGYLFIIFVFGLLDYKWGFMSKDIEKSEDLSPKWIEQMKCNKELLKEIKELKEILNNK